MTVDYMNFIGAGFTLKAPTSWLVISSSEYQTLWLSPPLTAEAQQYANMSLVIAVLESDITPDAYIEKVMTDQANTYAEFALLNERSVTADSGEQGVQVTMKWVNEAKGTPVHQIQTHFVQANRVYLFTGTRPVLDDTLAEKVDTVFATMIDKVRFETVPLFP